MAEEMNKSWVIEGVPYNGAIGATEGIDPLCREARIRRCTKAIFETWRAWAEDRGNRVNRWHEQSQEGLFDKIRRYADGGPWEPFPNKSWASETNIAGRTKSSMQIIDERAAQTLYQSIADELLKGLPQE